MVQYSKLLKMVNGEQVTTEEQWRRYRHVKTGFHGIRAVDWYLCMDFRDAKNV